MWVYTYINVFVGSILSIYQCKIHKSSQTLHTGPLRHCFHLTARQKKRLTIQISSQEQLEHAEVSTALRYLGQYYLKNKLYDEASLCAQRCCDYNDVSLRKIISGVTLLAAGGWAGWEAALTGAAVTCACRPARRASLCWGRSPRSETRRTRQQRSSSPPSQTTTLQSGGCRPSTSSPSHPDRHPACELYYSIICILWRNVGRIYLLLTLKLHLLV